MATVVEKATALEVIPLMVLDPAAAEQLLAERRRLGQDRKDEVWNGTYMMSPHPTFNHQELVAEIVYIFQVTQKQRGAKVYAGGNISDRERGWEKNYRCPDVVVLFPGNPAKNCNTVLVGGPDFAVEIISPHDMAHEKLPFYGKIKTLECLYINSDEKFVELYRLVGEQMELVAQLTAENGLDCSSQVLNLRFQVIAEGTQAILEVRCLADSSQSWRVELLN